MKLLKAEVHNFGSYAHLEFDFNDLGLALVHGSTGSGKSTLQDIVCWVLFGVTAKDGNADEVRSWTNPDEATYVLLDVEINGQLIGVHRIRGKATENDLYWHEGDSVTPVRGKDLTETQKLLEQRLGVSKDLYIAGAYYNEFSPTGAFFTAKAKNRRELFEKLADLDLPKTIAERTSDERKTCKKDFDQRNRQLDLSIGRLESLRSSYQGSDIRRTEWDLHHSRSIDLLRTKKENFEAEKEEKITKIKENIEKYEILRSRVVAELEKTALRLESEVLTNPKAQCPSCGQVNSKVTKDICRLEEIERDLKFHSEKDNPHTLQLEQARLYNNPYNEQIESEKLKENPFTAQIEGIGTEIEEMGQKVSQLKTQCSELGHTIASLTQLNELSFELRRVLLVRAVKEIEVSTNAYLEKYFDSELRVGFELEDSDDLNISITKNGYPGVYRQMSKGQRGLLKLCFSVSVMKAAANRAGVHFGLLCFDESLDGLDADLKVKAFSLFQELSLSHESILVVEHSSEFKQLFTNSFLVTMENDTSTIQEG